MNYSKNDIEYFLQHKEYFELTKDELALISTQIKNEQEYNQLKKLIISITNNPIDNNSIEPPSELKTSLLKEFRKTNNNNKIWLNGIVTTLFPENKKVIAMPGTQLIGVAATVLIIFSIYLNFEPSSSYNEISMSSNETEKIEFPESEPIITSTNDELDSSVLKEIEPVDKNIPIEEAIESESPTIISNNEITNIPPPVLEGVYIKDHLPRRTSLASERPTISSDDQIIELDLSEEESEYMESGSSVSEDSDDSALILSGHTSPSLDSKNHIEVIKITTISRSLNEDKELIALFYTAL